MNLQKKIAELEPEQVSRLLQLNYFKIGLELTEGSFEEKTLVSEVIAYQKNMWVSAFNDMFSKFAQGQIKGQDRLQPLFSGYFIAQLRKAFFETILAPKKKNIRPAPANYNYKGRTQNYNRSREGNSCKSMEELVRGALTSKVIPRI